MSKSVIAIAPSEAQAHSLVTSLRASGFTDADISVVRSSTEGGSGILHQASSKAPEGAAAGALGGGAVGGTLGVLAGIGLLAIPGLGPFIAAGPILAALSGVAVGATVGGVTGGLVGLGIPEIEAKAYESRLNRGEVLVAVHAETPERVTRAKAIFDGLEGVETRVVGEYAEAAGSHTRSSPDLSTPRHG